MHNLGLCIALWDIKHIEDAYIFPGDGASHSIVHFRYVVFRPFIDEILVGKIKSCSKEGVHGMLALYYAILPSKKRIICMIFNLVFHPGAGT